MWPCPKCREKVDDDFDVCWNCGTTKDGVEDPNFQKADDAPAVEDEPVAESSTAIREAPDEVVPSRTRATVNPLHCLRCRVTLKFLGTKEFHEGPRWGALGDIGELFVNKESFDVYVCQRCGHVEFFVTGIGAELRPHEVAE